MNVAKKKYFTTCKTPQTEYMSKLTQYINVIAFVFWFLVDAAVILYSAFLILDPALIDDKFSVAGQIGQLLGQSTNAATLATQVHLLMRWFGALGLLAAAGTNMMLSNQFDGTNYKSFGRTVYYFTIVLYILAGATATYLVFEPRHDLLRSDWEMGARIVFPAFTAVLVLGLLGVWVKDLYAGKEADGARRGRGFCDPRSQTPDARIAFCDATINADGLYDPFAEEACKTSIQPRM